MRYEQVKSLFLLYSGLPAVRHYEPLIKSAVREVEQMLLPTADPGDVRLEYLAAAICNLRYQELDAPRDRAACTYAGTVAQQTDSTQKLTAAKQLATDYRTLCRDLLQDHAFAFFFC